MNKSKRVKWTKFTIFPILLVSSVGVTSYTLVHKNKLESSTPLLVEQAATTDTPTDNNIYISLPILQGYNPDFPSRIPLFNISRLPNIHIEKTYKSLDVTKSQVKAIMLKNMQSFFGSTLSASSFEANLKKDSFNIINGPTGVNVSFVIMNIWDSKTQKPYEKKYDLIMDGFEDADWAQFTWLIFMGPVILGVILVVSIAIIATRTRLKQKRKSQIIDGEFIIE